MHGIRQDATPGGTTRLQHVEGANCPAEKLDSEHPLYILYTSGSTGKPKGACCTQPPGYSAGRVSDHEVRLRFEGSRTRTGAPPTSAGSPATAIRSTARSPTARPRSCTKARRIGPSRTASGASSTNIKSPFFIPRRPPSARLCVGAISGRRNTTSVPSASSACRSANQSIPKQWMWYHNAHRQETLLPIVDTWWQTENRRRS